MNEKEEIKIYIYICRVGFGASKESAPGSFIVVVQSMISFIVANTRRTAGLNIRTMMTMIVESV
jgi:hypothetical protein